MRVSLAVAALIAATPAGAQAWDAGLAERMAARHVPGVSVAVVDGCRIVDARGFGVATAAGDPVTPATLFQAASISKAVTAVAALRLAEEGRVALDTDVRTSLRQWALPGSSPVTLRALLGHVAGVNGPGFPGYARGASLPTLAQLLSGARPANTPVIRVDGPPGIWRYSGGGYEIAQAVLEDASGESFAALAERTVLAPAGMADSAFDQPLAPERAARAAAGFDGSSKPLRGGWRVYPELAAAGLWTTPSDLARFAIAVAQSVRGEGGPLSPESARAMMTPGPGTWGLGVALGPEGRFGHLGANAGFTSAFVFYPSRCQGAAVMTNGDAGQALVAEMVRAIGKDFGWPSAE